MPVTVSLRDPSADTLTSRSRDGFRETCLQRDGNTCIVPWCDATADEVHHIIERSLWENGGYFDANGASVCNMHHRKAERDEIPPHAFWRWLDVDPVTPTGFGMNITKWGDELSVPPWQDHREYIKYQSSRHLPFSHSRDVDDTEFRSVESFLDAPLVVTIKLDGGNASLVKDTDEPVRARNGKQANHESFDLLKQEYWERDLYSELPPYIQIYGEWLYAKHTIHYGCDGCCDDRNQAPPLDSYFYVFGVFDARYNTWLAWPEVEQWADRIGFPTAPTVRIGETVDDVLFETDYELYDALVADGERVVEAGHEGLVVRHTYPFHYGQFEQRLGKYVRENHVPQGSDHWKHQRVTPNHVND